MKLTLDKTLIGNYKSSSQIARILTEHWVNTSIFCPNCGNHNLDKYGNNQPVGDFFCKACNEDYELKSKKTDMGVKIIDGAYRTMLERLRSTQNPNFFLLNYDLKNLEVTNFLVIPKHYFVPEIIEKRRPLVATAQRAGWVGCNILLNKIPQTGKIYYIRNKIAEPKNRVLSEWKKTLFLREITETQSKGWLLDLMRYIDTVGTREFSLKDIYAFEGELKQLHPKNNHIKDKIRQQLQILRDKGYLEFMSQGHYRLV